MTLRKESLGHGLAVFAVVDGLLIWQMHKILGWHSWAVERLLDLAKVPWELGSQLRLLPGIPVSLVRTAYLDYRVHPYYPALFAVAALAGYGIAYRWMAAPIKPLLFLVPVSLGITYLYLQVNGPQVPYTPEEFCAMWLRGESILWLLLPLVFALTFFTLSVPLSLKIAWLAGLGVYSFVWSALRLGLALATFHYFGSIWMPLFYFAFGIVADFLYIVAFYSLAMDGAAAFLLKRKEAWQ